MTAVRSLAAAAAAVDSVDKPAIDSTAAMLVGEIQPRLRREGLQYAFRYTAIACGRHRQKVCTL